MAWIRRISLTLALTTWAGSAAAQSTGNAAAEALFQEGRALLEAGKFAEGCPKLAASQRLDPATGTLLALALCYEGEGKLASAWAAFTTLEGRSRTEVREDREKIARERAAALRPRLSTLAIDVPAEVATFPGLVVKVDGQVMAPGSFGVAVPVDGGEHRVEVSAPRKAGWQSVVVVKQESDAVRAKVPPLADVADDTPGSTPAAAAAPSPEHDAPVTEPGSGMRLAGLITAGVGVVTLGVGSYLALDAKSDYEAAAEHCANGTCPPNPYQETEDARSQGTFATVLFAVGGAAIGTGAALWLLAPSAEPDRAADGAPLRLTHVGLGPRGVLLRGSF